MDKTVKEYVFSLTAIAMLCGIAVNLTADSAGKGIIRLLCGLLLMTSALRPLSGIDPEKWLDLTLPAFRKGEALTQAGAEMSQKAAAAIIKTEVEAYILDKAAELGCTVQCSVTLDEELVPESLWLQGSISDAQRQRLEIILTNDLGIAKEHQLWSG